MQQNLEKINEAAKIVKNDLVNLVKQYNILVDQRDYAYKEITELKTMK